MREQCLHNAGRAGEGLEARILYVTNCQSSMKAFGCTTIEEVCEKMAIGSISAI